MSEQGNEFELWPSRFQKPGDDSEVDKQRRWCNECNAPTPHRLPFGCVVCNEARMAQHRMKRLEVRNANR